MSGFNINQVTFSGNLTRDPEVRPVGDTHVCDLRIANNTRKKEGDEWVDKPNYFSVSIWGGVGKHVGGRLTKGDRIVVSGRMEWREWEDKNGNTRQDYDVIADSVVTFDGGSGGSPGGGTGQASSDVPADTADLPTGGGEPPPSGADDDIPF